MRNRPRLLILASIVVSAALLAVILRDVPFADVVESMRGADAGYLLATFFIAAPLTLFTRGIRWWMLLSRRLPMSQAAHMVNIMFMGNQLPMRLGEVARGVLANRAGVPLVTSATSIVVERLIDTLVVVMLIVLSLSQLPDAPPQVNETAAAAGIAALTGFLLLLVLASAPQSCPAPAGAPANRPAPAKAAAPAGGAGLPVGRLAPAAGLARFSRRGVLDGGGLGGFHAALLSAAPGAGH